MNNQLDIPYIAGPKWEGVPFSGMIKLKLKFFKSMYNKITKRIFYFSFIFEFSKKKKRKAKEKKKEKRLHDTKTVKHRKLYLVNLSWR